MMDLLLEATVVMANGTMLECKDQTHPNVLGHSCQWRQH